MADSRTGALDVGDAIRDMTIDQLRAIDGVIRGANARLDKYYSGQESTDEENGWVRTEIGEPHYLYVLSGEGYEAQVELGSDDEGWEVDIFSTIGGVVAPVQKQDDVFRGRRFRTRYEAMKVAELIIKERYGS